MQHEKIHRWIAFDPLLQKAVLGIYAPSIDAAELILEEYFHSIEYKIILVDDDTDTNKEKEKEEDSEDHYLIEV